MTRAAAKRGNLRKRPGNLGRWFATACCPLPLALLGTGCAQLNLVPGARTALAPIARASGAEPGKPPVSPYCQVPQGALVQAAGADEGPKTEPEQIPVLPQKEPAPPPLPDTGHVPSHALPIGLDTVLRLAEDKNAKVSEARARVDEAYADKSIADAKWLPDIYVGTGFYRHEGGIQDPDGTFIHSSMGSIFAGMELCGHYDIKEIAYIQVDAQRKVWQQKGELSRITSEKLLDASQTYVDLLAVHNAEAIARDLEARLKDLLDQAQRYVKAGVAPIKVEVARTQAEIYAQQQHILKYHAQAAAAAAKLIYLLGLDPCAELLPVDKQLIPFELADANAPICDLVAKSLANGPGIREMEGLLALIEDSMAKAEGPSKYLPIFEVRMAEGAFGAGPGDNLTWDNRWDLCLQARWNLTDLMTAHDHHQAVMAKAAQAHLSYEDLRGKLTAGVQESRETILTSRDQIGLSRQQIEQAQEAYRRGDLRLKNDFTPSSFSEMLNAVRGLGEAQRNYLQAIIDHDKAQLQLMVLVGGNGNGCHGAP